MVAVPGDAHDKVAVIFGVRLRVTERFFVYDVELYVMAAQLEICAYQRAEAFCAASPAMAEGMNF